MSKGRDDFGEESGTDGIRTHSAVEETSLPIVSVRSAQRADDFAAIPSRGTETE
ncbi:hypothetical protein V1J52_11645 [Streptomyces sp. TRM 70351]|uniref:hypothetical protein n=1 Tax=Streptomyces sp. TRM 70351 TaxID=3116552 RepID=UPI002E7AB39A|nr:hypothetical protein [Streptomyces sp. TRM 70351]MEE1928827.1 hypothetical protein [Streptomyces sp. TRM 70351]